MSSRILDAVRRRKWLVVAGGALLASLGVGIGLVSQLGSSPDDADFRVRGVVPASRPEFAVALYQSLGMRLSGGHHVTLLQNGRVFDAMVDQIGRAKSSLHLLMYIWERGAASDRVVAALVAKARAGIPCRILVDDLGSPDFAETVQPPLASAGCQVRIFRPLPGGEKLARNHRKLLIVDGLTAITGGFGIRDNWLGNGDQPESWRDSNVLFSGPSVTEAQQAFAENWQEAGGALLPSDTFPTPDSSGNVSAAFIASSASVVTRSERLLQLMIASAQQRIWIANAYFVPSEAILDLLKSKARAGVDVRILAPDENSDSKTAFGAQHIEYGSLLELGVRVWEYTASMMHAKTMVIDDEMALIGSINFDPLSLNHLEEVGLLVRDPGVTQELAATFVVDCKRARELKD